MNLTIGLTYDLRRDYLALGFTADEVAEFDSDATLEALDTTIQSLGYRTERIGHARALCRRLVSQGTAGLDLVFNIAEGMNSRSREAQVPCLLDLYGLGYTFSDPLVCAVTLEKSMAKRLVAGAGLHTAPFQVVQSAADIAAVRLPFPLFAKPIAEGTGKGIDQHSRIESPARLAQVCHALLQRYRQPVLVEEYLPGREFTVGLLGTGPEARVLGTMEITMLPQAQTDIYSLEVKEKCEDLVRYSPLAHGPLRVAVEDLALQSYRTLECRDAGRVDVRLDRAGQPAFLEVNPLPGLHPQHSDLPMIATQEQMSYAELIRAIIDSARRRLGIPAHA